jgi:hypothetical protein
MNNNHPVDMDIQQYALDKAACPAPVINHIESCIRCSEEVNNYQLLFSGIKQHSSPVFDFDLSALLLPKLPPVNAPLAADRFIAGFLILFILSCIGIPMYLFRIYLLNMFSGVSPFFIYSILASAAVIVAIKILELYHKYQKQIRLLNFN